MLRNVVQLLILLFSLAAWAVDDGDALLAAIAAHPEEDTPRLAYADWLEEHGDPRAEFIRLQIALETEPPSPKRRKMEQREAQLLRANIERYGLVKDKSVLRYSFRRGFVDLIELSGPILTQPGALEKVLEKCPGVTQIELAMPSDLSQKQWEEFTQCPRSASIRTIRFFPRESADLNVAVAALAASPYLKPKNLHFLSINPSEERMRALLASPAASQLQGFKMRLTAEMVIALAESRKFEAIHDLGLDLWDEGGENAFHALVHSPKLAHLKHLKIDGSRARFDRIVTHIATSPQIEGLESLRLGIPHGDNPLSLRAMQTFVGSSQFATLKHLSLVTFQLEDKALEAFVGWRALPNLESLELQGGGLSSENVRLLAKANLSGLNRLSLFGNAVDAQGAQALALAPHLKNLRSLTVSDNPIGDEGLKILIRSPNFRNLDFLRAARIGLMNPRTLLDSQSQLSALTEVDLDGSTAKEEEVTALLKTGQMEKVRIFVGSGLHSRDIHYSPQQLECEFMLSELAKMDVGVRR